MQMTMLILANIYGLISNSIRVVINKLGRVVDKHAFALSCRR